LVRTRTGLMYGDARGVAADSPAAGEPARARCASYSDDLRAPREPAHPAADLAKCGHGDRLLLDGGRRARALTARASGEHRRVHPPRAQGLLRRARAPPRLPAYAE